MAIISYRLTSEEFTSGIKTRTSRIWKPRYFADWQRWFDTGRLVHQGYDRSPRNGGMQIGHFRLTRRPYLQLLGDMSRADLLAEGGMCDDMPGFYDLIGYGPTQEVAVLWFDYIPLDDTKGQFLTNARSWVNIFNGQKWARIRKASEKFLLDEIQSGRQSIIWRGRTADFTRKTT